jgi:hypothetical protein
MGPVPTYRTVGLGCRYRDRLSATAGRGMADGRVECVVAAYVNVVFVVVGTLVIVQTTDANGGLAFSSGWEQAARR